MSPTANPSITPKPRKASAAQDPPEESTKLGQVREQAKTVAADIGDLGTLAKEAALETVDSARHRVVAAGEQGKEKVVAFEDQMLEYISKRPLKSVLIAAGVGALLGAILRR